MKSKVSQYLLVIIFFVFSDTMGNKGAFITLKGKDMVPNYTTYEAVPHPNVKPMAYASALMSLMC